LASCGIPSIRHGSCSFCPDWFFSADPWPMLLTPLVAYVVFKLRIHCEHEYLVQRFGEAYIEYRHGVNELFPISRSWPRTGGSMRA
jgi:protein-S-isoprenylcysteine O-methyltransferase Ste14